MREKRIVSLYLAATVLLFTRARARASYRAPIPQTLARRDRSVSSREVT